MVTKEELQEGIRLCQIGEPTPEKMIRLGAYYTVMEHLFGEDTPEKITSYSMAPAPQEPKPGPIDTSGNSDFLWSVRGKNTASIMNIMDELMDTMKVIQPRIYDSVMRRVSEIK